MSFITNPLVYYPISGILWLWHTVFVFLAKLLPGADHPESNGIVWALAVVFLVVTLRVILFWPAAKQIRFSRKMQEMQPKMKALQARYKNDREKLATETRKLQKEEGFNPLLGCLPMFIQIPVFLGLFHVLRSFNRMGNSFGQMGMSAEETRNTGNYVFSAADVQSFLDARLFGAPLSAYIQQPAEQFQAFVDPGMPIDFARWNIWVIALPLMIISAVTTHFNARLSVSRQSAEAAANPQAAIMNRMMLWIFPIGILVTGAFLPVAILIYMVVNNGWTFGQQRFLFGRMAKEDDEAARKRREHLDSLAPKVGVKPTNPKKKGQAAAGGSGVAVAEGSAAGGADGDSSVAGSVAGAGSGAGAGAKPRPGQKPVRPAKGAPGDGAGGSGSGSGSGSGGGARSGPPGGQKGGAQRGGAQQGGGQKKKSQNAKKKKRR